MRPSQNVWWGSLVLKGLGWVPVQLGARALQAPGLPAAVPHPRSAAGTPHCSPVAPAHTVAPASSLSETWGPEPRTPGGWVCWAHLQPSGSLKTGGHSQFLAGGSLGGSPPSDLPRLSHLCWPLASRLTQPATPCRGHPASTSLDNSEWLRALPVPREGEHQKLAAPSPSAGLAAPLPPAHHPRKGRGYIRHQH